MQYTVDLYQVLTDLDHPHLAEALPQLHSYPSRIEQVVPGPGLPPQAPRLEQPRNPTRHQSEISCDGDVGQPYQSCVTDKLASEPQEWFLEVVVGFRRDVVVLQVLLAMEGNRLGFDFALLDIHFVTAEDDRDVFAHSDKITCHY